MTDRSWPIEDISAHSWWTNWNNLRIVGIPGKIQTRHSQNTRQAIADIRLKEELNLYIH